MILYRRILAGSLLVAIGMGLYVFPLWNLLGILMSLSGMVCIAAGFREARIPFFPTIALGVGILYLLFAAGIMAEAVNLSLSAELKSSGENFFLPRAFFVHSTCAPLLIVSIVRLALEDISWKKLGLLWLILYSIYPSVFLSVKVLAQILPGSR